MEDLFRNVTADKPKVYQGVRVKTTVKELLQKHRALQAQKTATKSQAVAARDVCSTTMNTHLDIFGMQAPEPYFQTHPFPENINIPMENAYDHQQMMHMMPPETFSCSNFVCPTSAQWSNGYLPSNTDLYGTTSLVLRSPSDSINLPSPVDYNSYSPPQSNSSSSSCYNSPTRMDLSSSFSPENYHYQHCNLQHCFCLSHWSNVQEGMATSEFAPYGSSDCLYSYGDDSYFRRDTSNSDMCYL